MDLLERESYLTELRRLMGDATESHGRLLLLGGEAGVGKTSLVNTFCQQVDGEIAQIRSASDALSTPSPLSAVRAYAASLGVPFDLDAHEQRQRDTLFHALLTAIGRHDQPLLMVLEDAHWADEASLDFVRFVGRRMADLPLLWIVTYRDDEIGLHHPLQRILGDLATAPGLRRMTLAPLTEVAVRSLAHASSVDPVELFRSTGGNPFYVTEVLAAGNTAIPASVSDAVLARASRLSAAARDVLKTAAVIGARVDPDLLLNVAGPVLDEIEECVDSGLLRVDGDELGFRHQITRDSIYATIIPPRRRLLHGRALAMLQNQPDRERHLARLAHHAELAGDREQTFEFALAAAQQAVESRAHREAAAQYARGIRVAGTVAPNDRAKLLECWSYECYLTDQIEDAINGRRGALEIWRDTGEQVRVGDNLRWLSRLYWFTGRNQEADEAATAALGVLEPLSPGPQLAWGYSSPCLPVPSWPGPTATWPSCGCWRTTARTPFSGANERSNLRSASAIRRFWRTLSTTSVLLVSASMTSAAVRNSSGALQSHSRPGLRTMWRVRTLTLLLRRFKTLASHQGNAISRTASPTPPGTTWIIIAST